MERKNSGVYVLLPADNDTLEIKAIAVDEPFQNMGLGKYMLKDAELKAIEKGYQFLIIGTPTTAKKQISIYNKAGFDYFYTKHNFFIINYSAPIFEDGIQLKDMIMLKKRLV